MKLFNKPKSKFYWYDFTVQGHRYRGLTHETRSARALKTAGLKLASVMENTDPLPRKPTALGKFAERQLRLADTATNAPQSGGVEDERSNTLPERKLLFFFVRVRLPILSSLPFSPQGWTRDLFMSLAGIVMRPPSALGSWISFSCWSEESRLPREEIKKIG